MKILVASDSHGDNQTLKDIAKKHPDMDYYIHLGDSESDEYTIFPFVSVRGNCDYYPFEEQMLINTPYGKLYATHKPYGKEKFIHENDIKIFLHGHTHIRRKEKIDGVYYLNPGAISFPRDGEEQSYMILYIDCDKITCRYFNYL